MYSKKTNTNSNMEENSAAVECLILFYINMKYVLKTKQLVERVFIDQMIKSCKENGFKYGNEEIKNTWESLVSKYLSLKSNGTVEEKEKWNYFEILDSCYEHSDFNNGVHPKFSDEMVWFLIECFLKRKALKKTHKHSNIVNEIYKEFMKYGYLYITKQDIDNKWRHLNLKYEKLKNNPESVKKWPYLQALKGFHQESGRHIVNMVFTRELTEILIERFTVKKVTCVIHGYDSDQVLSEIQSEFKDLGFFFSKDSIKEKWRTLTNVYKFLIVKGNKDTSWIYFEAMRNHFKDDFSFSWDETNTNQVRGRRMRQRSKSVGPEHVSKKSRAPNLVVQLEKVLPLHLLKIKDDDEIPRKKKSSKRSSSEHRRIKSRKKLKIRRHSNTSGPNNTDPYEVTDGSENKIQSNEISSGNVTFFQTNPHLQKLPFNDSQERRTSVDLGSPTSKVHIINIDHSDIDRNSGNLTINLPSITKQFSDNEFLPLKKRLRVEGDAINIDSGTSNEITDGFRGFPTQAIAQKAEMSKDKRLTEDEMDEIMERINKENTTNCDMGNKSSKGLSYGTDELHKYRSTYGSVDQCLIVPKKEQEDNRMQNYGGPGSVPQPPVLLLVIKVDGGNNPVRDNMPKADSSNNPVRDTKAGEDNAKTGTCSPLQHSPSKAEVFEKRPSETDKQKSEQAQVSKDFVKPISPKGKTIIISNKKNLVPLKLSCWESSTTPKSSEAVSESIKNGSSNSAQVLTDNELVNSASLNTNVSSETSSTSDTVIILEDETVCSPEEGTNKELHVKKQPQGENVEDIIFHEPLTVAAKNEMSTKLKILDRTPVTVSENNFPAQTMKPPISTGKIRLPVKGGKLKEIFISPGELNKIKLKPQNLKLKSNYLRKPGDALERNLLGKKAPEFKFISQVVKPATRNNEDDKTANPRYNLNDAVSESIEDNALLSAQSLNAGSKVLGLSPFGRNGKNEEFDNESVMSEAMGDEEGLKDNLLATVIDFQEHNNQEFIEIKNLMKQNNLLQRETNRLLRLMLEKQ